jgi:hypothetical protein
MNFLRYSLDFSPLASMSIGGADELLLILSVTLEGFLSIPERSLRYDAAEGLGKRSLFIIMEVGAVETSLVVHAQIAGRAFFKQCLIVTLNLFFRAPLKMAAHHAARVFLPACFPPERKEQ